MQSLTLMRLLIMSDTLSIVKLVVLPGTFNELFMHKISLAWIKIYVAANCNVCFVTESLADIPALKRTDIKQSMDQSVS